MPAAPHNQRAVSSARPLNQHEKAGVRPCHGATHHSHPLLPSLSLARCANTCPRAHPCAPAQGKTGTVVKDGLGWTAGELIAADLQQLGVSPGWHQLVVQGKATDPRRRLTQTGEAAMLFGAYKGPGLARGGA